MSIKEMNPQTLKGLMEAGKAVLIDVREVHENARESIPGAFLAPLSAYNPENLPAHAGKVVVFHCASGNRTWQYGHALSQTVPQAADTYHLGGGIMAWRMAGFKTEQGGGLNRMYGT